MPFGLTFRDTAFLRRVTPVTFTLDDFESYSAGGLDGLNGGVEWGGAFADRDGLSALNNDWVDRVLNAGGAMPSSTTLAANDVFYAALVSAGIDTKIKVVNTIAPDNLIAACTPLIYNSIGNASWTNNGPFTSGDLTVNGLLGNGTSKYLATGFKPNNFMTNASAFFGAYVHTGDKSTGQNEIGAVDDGTHQMRLYYQFNDNKTYYNGFNSTSVGAVISSGTLTGYVGVSKTATNRVDVYYATSGSAHASNFNSTTTDTVTPPSSRNIVCFATDEAGTVTNWTKKRVSGLFFGTALTGTESSNFYNAFQTLRTSYGGGYV